MNQFDFNEFMWYGSSSWPVPQDILMATKAAFDSEPEWKTIERRSVKTPTWCLTDQAHSPTIDRYHQLLDHADQWIHTTFGDTFNRSMVDMWIGTSEMDWHNENDNRISLFLYVGNQVQWDRSNGGLLEVKNTLIEDVKSYAPSFGTAVVLNNLSYMYQHRVTAINPQVWADRALIYIEYNKTAQLR